MRHGFRQLPWPLSPHWVLVWGVWRRGKGRGRKRGEEIKGEGGRDRDIDDDDDDEGRETEWLNVNFLISVLTHISSGFVFFRLWTLKETLGHWFLGHFTLFISRVFGVHHCCPACFLACCHLNPKGARVGKDLREPESSDIHDVLLREQRCPKEAPQGFLREDWGSWPVMEDVGGQTLDHSVLL